MTRADAIENLAAATAALERLFEAGVESWPPALRQDGFFSDTLWSAKDAVRRALVEVLRDPDFSWRG